MLDLLSKMYVNIIYTTKVKNITDFSGSKKYA